MALLLRIVIGMPGHEHSGSSRAATRAEVAKIVNDAFTSHLTRKLSAALDAALEPVFAKLEALRTARVSSPATSRDHAEAQIESFKRYLVEDCLLVIASELFDDAIAIQVMQRLGIYERFAQLCRAVMHWRATPETDAAAELHAFIRHLPVAQRPSPFDKLTEPILKGPIHD